MTNPDLTDSAIVQGCALVEAIKALAAIELPNPFERAVAKLFQAAYRRQLMEIIEAAPSWVVDQLGSLM